MSKFYKILSNLLLISTAIASVFFIYWWFNANNSLKYSTHSIVGRLLGTFLIPMCIFLIRLIIKLNIKSSNRYKNFLIENNYELLSKKLNELLELGILSKEEMLQKHDLIN